MTPSRTLLVEGWRNIAHSYAIVNQFQCLELLKIPDLRLMHRDVPYYGEHWQRMQGLFPPAAESAIATIPVAPADAPADAILRISFPYNCAPSQYRRTGVFGTSEFGYLPDDHLVPRQSLRMLAADSDIVFLVPSRWSRNGFLRSGANPRQVEVVPHGFDPAIYYPPAHASSVTAASGTFTFLTVGSMSSNKGLPLLLKAFAAVAQKFPHARLVAKGLGALYPSRDLKDLAVKQLTTAETYQVRDRLTYIGETLSFEQMADLYRVADVYVSPYSGEGFNLPVLEAAACGAVIICTSGGSTDDFTRPEFTLPIEATLREEQFAAGAQGLILRPDFDHLVHQMSLAIESPQYRAQARIDGPAFLSSQFTWRHAVEQLIKVLFP
jgi:glycosyltransferase involved in cell wall biosynthesis